MKKVLITTFCAAMMSSTVFAAPSTSDDKLGHSMVKCGTDNTVFFYCQDEQSQALGFFPATPFPISLVAGCPAGTVSAEMSSREKQAPNKATFYMYEQVGVKTNGNPDIEFQPLKTAPTNCSQVTDIKPEK